MDSKTYRLQCAFEERVRSLLNDRYCQRYCSRQQHFWKARLHHMANGNDIVITADYSTMTLTQKTNGLLTHIGAY